MHSTEVRARALALVAVGANESAVAQRLGIGRTALRRWLADPRGSSAGARPCPAPLAPNADYAALLGFYLGDGHLARFPRYYALRIACDATQPKVIADVESLLRSVHPERPTFVVQAPGCAVVQSSWKHWPCLFPQHGPGRKHERHLGMAAWQWMSVEEHPADFLRGLFHSDGCLVSNRVYKNLASGRKAYVYPRWQFCNASEEILGWCGKALDLVHVAWRRSNTRIISVSRRDDVARLTSLIGTKR